MSNRVHITDKYLGDLHTKIYVEVGFGRHLEFYIWKSYKGLYRNTGFDKKDYGGAYVSCASYDLPAFGEVHLLKEHLGVGYVAHELMHFMYDWMCFYHLSDFGSNRINEPLAALMGNVSREFWDKVYEEISDASPGGKDDNSN